MKLKKDKYTDPHSAKKMNLPQGDNKTLVDFFALLLEWDQKENVAKGYANATQVKRNPNNTNQAN